jgi:hypothetical protein
VALGVLCGGLVVAGQVSVWWSPDKHLLFSKYFKTNPFFVTDISRYVVCWCRGPSTVGASGTICVQIF